MTAQGSLARASDHDGGLPCFGALNAGTVDDVTLARARPCTPRTIVLCNGTGTTQRPGTGTPPKAHCATRMNPGARKKNPSHASIRTHGRWRVGAPVADIS